jgi:hypothetical protein
MLHVRGKLLYNITVITQFVFQKRHCCVRKFHVLKKEGCTELICFSDPQFVSLLAS